MKKLILILFAAFSTSADAQNLGNIFGGLFKPAPSPWEKDLEPGESFLVDKVRYVCEDALWLSPSSIVVVPNPVEIPQETMTAGESITAGNVTINCLGEEPAYLPRCTMHGPGFYKPYNQVMGSRVAVDGVFVSAAAVGEFAIKDIKERVAAGTCEVYPTEPCRLLGFGPYGKTGGTYNHRIAIGKEVVYGLNKRLDIVQERLAEIRAMGLCY